MFENVLEISFLYLQVWNGSDHALQVWDGSNHASCPQQFVNILNPVPMRLLPGLIASIVYVTFYRLCREIALLINMKGLSEYKKNAKTSVTTLSAKSPFNSIIPQECISQASFSYCWRLSTPSRHLIKCMTTDGRPQRVPISLVPITTLYMQHALQSFRPEYHRCKHQAPDTFGCGVWFSPYTYQCILLINNQSQPAYKVAVTRGPTEAIFLSLSL